MIDYRWLGLATVTVVGLCITAGLLLYPENIAESTAFRLAATDTPGWQEAVCISGPVLVSVSWFDSSLIHNATSSSSFGPLFTATVLAWGANGSLSHPAYNSTGTSGNWSFVSSGPWHFTATDTRSTEAVSVVLSWTVPGHLLTGPDGPVLC